jgi:hypothetical protein
MSLGDGAKIAVVLPTVPGRELILGRSVASHAAGADALHILKGYTTCGAAWNAGALLALADPAITHVLFSADDLLALPGWQRAAAASVDQGFLPNAILRDAETNAFWNVQDGNPGQLCAFPRVPFLPVALLRRLLPIPPLHYYSDSWVGARAADLGWPTRVTAGFEFVHLWAAAGRIADSDPDRAAYETIMGQGAL